MQVQTTHPPADEVHWASADMLRITVAQMRAWEAEAARHCATLPKSDEEAWEGTELDALRTTL